MIIQKKFYESSNIIFKRNRYQIDFENEYSSGDAIESNSFYEFAPQSGFKRVEKGFLAKIYKKWPEKNIILLISKHSKQ